MPLKNKKEIFLQREQDLKIYLKVQLFSGAKYITSGWLDDDGWLTSVMKHQTFSTRSSPSSLTFPPQSDWVTVWLVRPPLASQWAEGIKKKAQYAGTAAYCLWAWLGDKKPGFGPDMIVTNLFPHHTTTPPHHKLRGMRWWASESVIYPGDCLF